jgi:hypothetical protein
MMKNLLPAHAPEGLIHHALCSGITITKGRSDQIVIAIQEYIVHAPGIDAHAGDPVTKSLSSGLQSDLNLIPQPNQIPNQSAAELPWSIFEPVQFLQHHCRILKISRKNSTTRGSQINRQMDWVSNYFHGFFHIAKCNSLLPKRY